MKDFCTIANPDCEQPAEWVGSHDVLENTGPLVNIPTCYRCGEPVCTSCGKPWLVFWFHPVCFVAQGEELVAVVERMKVRPQ